MKPIKVSETIHAPIERVFAVASDLPNAAERISGINWIEILSDGPMGMGTKWRESRTMMGKEATEVMWITEWHPPTRYVVEAESHGCHYVTPITFEEIGQNETRMTMEMRATALTFSAKIMMVLFSFMAKHVVKCLSDDLADIKRACETDAAPGPATTPPDAG